MASLISSTLSEYPSSVSATYHCTVANSWKEEYHPFEYPKDGGVLSPPVLVSHNRKYKMWKPYIYASDAVEEVAETGGTDLIRSELETAQEKNSVGEFVVGKEAIATDDYQQLDDITLTPSFDSMSSITMLSPSHDTFTGFYNFKPVMKNIANPMDNTKYWFSDFRIDTYSWDAGTRYDENYDSTAPIQRANLEVNGFPVTSWQCVLAKTSCRDHDNVRYGEFKRDCEYVNGITNFDELTETCNKKFKGKRIFDWCPNACGICQDEVFLI